MSDTRTLREQIEKLPRYYTDDERPAGPLLKLEDLLALLPVESAPSTPQIQERLKALTRDIGNVGCVAERRQVFDKEHERIEHQQMLARLRQWQSEIYGNYILDSRSCLGHN